MLFSADFDLSEKGSLVQRGVITGALCNRSKRQYFAQLFHRPEYQIIGAAQPCVFLEIRRHPAVFKNSPMQRFCQEERKATCRRAHGTGTRWLRNRSALSISSATGAGLAKPACNRPDWSPAVPICGCRMVGDGACA